MNLAAFIPIFTLVISVSSQNTNNELCGDIRCKSDECCTGVVLKRCQKLGSAGASCGVLTCPCQDGLHCISVQDQIGVCKSLSDIIQILPPYFPKIDPGSLTDVADDVPTPNLPAGVTEGSPSLVKRQAGGLIGGILGNLPIPKLSNGSAGGILGGLPIPFLSNGSGGGIPIPGLPGGIPIPGLPGGIPIPGLTGGLPIPGLSGGSGGGLPIPGLSGLFGGGSTSSPYRPGSIIFPGMPAIPIPGLPGDLNLPQLFRSLPIPGISNTINIPQLLRSLPIPGMIIPFPGFPNGIPIPGFGGAQGGSGGLLGLFSGLGGGLPIPGLGGLPIPGLGGLPIPGLG